jgi:hypothetical protein
MAKNRNQSTPMDTKIEEVTATVTDPQLAAAMNEAASAPVPEAPIEPLAPPADDLIKIDNSLDDEDQKKVRAFLQEVVAARTARAKAEQPVPPAPLTDRQKQQIADEQEAGRRSLAKHAEQQKARPAPVREPTEGTSNPVFRPGDYVPDQMKGQGNVGARTVPTRE